MNNPVDSRTYPGDELELFAHARTWKAYWSSKVAGYISGDVLEVGAGIGTNTELLQKQVGYTSWTCVEPDARLVAQIAALNSKGTANKVFCGTLAELDPSATYDTVIYIDVLEHIADDRSEVSRAWSRLNPGGHILVLSPAHQGLFSLFDEQVGHVRRYNAESLRAVKPATAVAERLFYLDAVGMLSSYANRMLLKQSYPTVAQIKFWDRVLIPISKLIDPLLLHRVGKTIVAVWRK